MLLALIPSVIALGFYLLSAVFFFKNSSALIAIFSEYLPSPETAEWVGKILSGLSIVFVFLLMSCTFVVVVGIIAAPFNSMLSARIEAKLGGQRVEGDRGRTLRQISEGLGKTFMNEIKKLIFILVMSGVAFLLGLAPVLYPVSIFFFSLLLAVQFLDYSWSRHELEIADCLRDVIRNIIPYGLSGFLFLLLLTVPIINAFLPALATSYYTVLWLQRQNNFRAPALDL